MTKEAKEDLFDQVSMCKLIPVIQDRTTLFRADGTPVNVRTIYRAFKKERNTPTQKLVLKIARELVDEMNAKRQQATSN